MIAARAWRADLAGLPSMQAPSVLLRLTQACPLWVDFLYYSRGSTSCTQ